MTRVPPLTPWPLRVLAGRCAREWARDRALLGLPSRSFFRADPALDLSCEIGGARAANPAGIAAGPHTQLAGNIVRGWLAGARSFELKTVQALDAIEIPRPCIEVDGLGYNVEWSQELSLDESLREYVTAAMLLEILGGWPELRAELGDPGPHVLELSVGYDLAGVASPRMRDFIATLCDAGAVLDGLRRELPPPLDVWREHPFRRRLVGGATLSTFHGCPPSEVASIVRHLMEVHDLDVTIKLNPTLLGERRVEAILRDLGYEDIALEPAAFAEDLALDAALDLIRGLDALARARGRRFGIKLTNTLVVRGGRGRLPGRRVYLSGPPLHALAAALLDELAGRLPGLLRLGPADEGTVPVAFSAGVGRGNFAVVAGIGLAPVTVCTDLLHPGGYGRLGGMLRSLQRQLRAAGLATLNEWVALRHAAARAAGHRDAAAAHAASLTSPAGAAPYRRENVQTGRRARDARLALWDCSACNLCESVCPNGAMLSLPSPAESAEGFAAKHQLVCLAELCNACGNCETFCPEEGAPFAVKPRLFLDRARFAADAGPAFHVGPSPGTTEPPFVVTAAAAVAGEAGRLAALLNGPQGLPLRAEDLT